MEKGDGAKRSVVVTLAGGVADARSVLYRETGTGAPL